MSLTIAVTGGRGFVGERLVARLVSEGHAVRLLTRRHLDQALPGVTCYQGDLTQAECALEQFVDGADVLYHCAGEIRSPERMEAVHVTGTRRLIDASAGRIGRWVQLSSVGAYGPVASGVVTEEWPDRPSGEYERTKSCSDELVRSAAAAGSFAAVILRPSIIYGPTMRNQSLFQLINAIDRRLFFFVGPAGASAHYVHVEDVVDALRLCAHREQAMGQTYILSEQRSIESLVEIIDRALGKTGRHPRLPTWLAKWIARAGSVAPRFPLTQARIAALTNRAVYSTRKINSELGYQIRIPLEVGVEELVATMKQRPHPGTGASGRRA